MTVELCSFTNKFVHVGRVCDSDISPIRTQWYSEADIDDFHVY